MTNPARGRSGAGEEPVVRAAGGILRRPGPAGAEIAVVHRPRYDDWTFPKGKLDPAERDEDAAIREVREETGLRCALERPAGIVRYRDARGRPKEVRYWVMRVLGGRFAPNREVDEIRWLPVEDAARLLTYEHDRALLARLSRDASL